MLIAIDDSEASRKALDYVGSWLEGRGDAAVHLLHVLPPLPPSLLEFAGSEDPAAEKAQEDALSAEQARWVEEQRKNAEPVFAHAREMLQKHGIAAESVHTHHHSSVSRQELVPIIVDTAKASGCCTIVVGRTAFHGWHRVLGHHVSDQLLKQCPELTVWVVE